nr:Vacuolar protein-sorting-associated protein 36 [Polyrhizophydium stewartii]
MEWLEPLDLTVGRRPVLLDGEVVACTSSEVGLYLGSERIAELDSGTLYVTSHRLLWVDEPKNHAVQLRLALVLDAESAGRFLRSSPKITLRLLDPDAAAAQLEAVSGVPSALQQAIVSGASAAALRMTLPDWVCEICDNTNSGEDAKCALCGVPNSNPVGLAVPTVGPARVSTPAATAKSPILKLSFRGGGMTEAFKQLRQALDAKAWEETQKRMGASVDDAFSDLTSLMDKASEMVRLAESISARLAASGTHSDSPEMVLFRNYLAELGISNPVTKETAGDLYAQELARQLADFLDRMLKARQGDMVPLTDLYCLFNRARGVALVSPEDIYRSASEFERLRLPFRLRKFDSGLLVVQSDILLFSISHSDDAVAAHILEALADVQTGLTAVALAKRDGISVLLATEQLLMTERSGLTCRDDTVEGLFFYPNRFVD